MIFQDIPVQVKTAADFFSRIKMRPQIAAAGKENPLCIFQSADIPHTANDYRLQPSLLNPPDVIDRNMPALTGYCHFHKTSPAVIVCRQLCFLFPRSKEIGRPPSIKKGLLQKTKSGKNLLPLFIFKRKIALLPGIGRTLIDRLVHRICNTVKVLSC